MIIYLYGPDSYRRRKKLNEILSGYRAKYTTHDLLEIDAGIDEDAWTKARDFLSQPSMFVESKVLVLKDAAHQDHSEGPEIAKSEIDSKKTFIIISDAAPAHPSFSFLFKDAYQTHEFFVPTPSDFEKFITDEAKARGLSFDQEARRYFAGFIRQSFPPDEPRKGISFGSERMWRAITEIEKIALVHRGGVISRVQIERYGQFLVEKNFYDLTTLALRGRDKKSRFLALEELFAGNFDPARIFNTIAFFASGADAALLAEKDIGVKSGLLDYDTALLSFVLK